MFSRWKKKFLIWPKHRGSCVHRCITGFYFITEFYSTPRVCLKVVPEENKSDRWISSIKFKFRLDQTKTCDWNMHSSLLHWFLWQKPRVSEPVSLICKHLIWPELFWMNGKSKMSLSGCIIALWMLLLLCKLGIVDYHVRNDLHAFNVTHSQACLTKNMQIKPPWILIILITVKG